ncbi:MAG: hypothetical protein WC028_17815 [Candidatus Obscuribacterales bacterium]
MIFARTITTLFLNCILFFSSQSCLAKPITPEWIINQKEDDFGDTVVYVWHDGARLVCKKFGCELLCKAPDWKVHCYNVAEKTEWIGDLSQFSGVVMANPFAIPRAYQVAYLREVEAGEYAGLKYTKYRTPVSRKDLILAASEIPVADEVGEFLSRLYVVPNSHNVPLFRDCDRGKGLQPERFKIGAVRNGSANDLRGGVLHKLVTKSWKKTTFNSSDFELPKGFERRKDIIQVSYSANKKEELGSFLNELGFKTKVKQ